MSFGNRLITLRNKNNLSQTQVANSIDISLRTIQRYESEEREPNMSALIALADFFDVSIDYLVGRTNDSRRNGS